MVMAKQYDFDWQRPVPDALKNGAMFDRYDEVCQINTQSVLLMNFNNYGT